MKRYLALILALCLLISCCGCNLFGSKKSTSSKKATSDVSSEDSAEDTQSNKKTSAKKKAGTISTDGTATKSVIIPESEELSDALAVVESGTAVSTLDTPWDKCIRQHKAGSTDALAAMRRNAILSSVSTYNVSGTTYYVSPNGDDNNDGKSPSTALKNYNASAISGKSLKPGDAVLFERGGVWRVSNIFKCVEGVTYGAYGTGEKPAFYGSQYNYASPDFWTPSKLKNVWKVSVRDLDIGILVVNHGEIVGKKTKNGLLALQNNGDFYFNAGNSLLYMYCDKGNPGRAFKDIELGQNKAIIAVDRISGVTIDNFKIKYGGRLGIDLTAADNSKVTNCEVGFIGGSYQNSNTRLGNAIQMWQGCNGHLVENCWVYQIYDTGITFQGDSLNPVTRCKQGTHDEDYLNITYRNNLVEYCCLSFEFWQGNHNDGASGSYEYTDARFENIHIDNNISRFAGYGWSSFIRPDHHGEHIVVYNRALPYSDDCYIEKNLFDLCDAWICRWQFNSNYSEDTNEYTRKKIGGTVEGTTVIGGTPVQITNKLGNWTIRNNTYYHSSNTTGGINWYGSQKTGSGQASLESILKQFDSNPTAVWIE